jgi:hypothetical protein
MTGLSAVKNIDATLNQRRYRNPQASAPQGPQRNHSGRRRNRAAKIRVWQPEMPAVVDAFLECILVVVVSWLGFSYDS